MNEEIFMKKIMIFYGSYGGGHLSAARSIKEYIENTYKDAEVYMVDCVEYINKIINKVTTTAYSELAKKMPWAWGYVYKKSEKGIIAKISSDSNKLMAHRLNKLLQAFKLSIIAFLVKLLQEYKPDYVISTHPFSSQMCAYLKKKNKANFILSTVMTDFAPHDQWLLYNEEVNYFFVAHSAMREALIQKKIPENKVFATGIPLSNRFLEHYNKKDILEEFGLKPKKINVLFFAGGEFGLGKSNTFEVLKTFAENFPDVQIVAIAGKNKNMKEKFTELVEETDRCDTIKVLDYTNKVPELMSVSDLVVTKPGGLTTTESLASGLPIIVINPIPGQEEENAQFLEENGLAIWIKKDDNIKEILNYIFSNPEKMKEMKIRARLFAKKHSTQDICKTIFKN